jgi:hypothetical protein
MNDIPGIRINAFNKFRKARRRAVLISLLARLTGESDELLAWQEVSHQLNLVHPNKRYLANVPIDEIVGSVNRYHDFNRKFYPLSDDDEYRWAKVEQLVEVQGLDPVEVYRVGDVYFVYDGNHRVSVARQNEATHIEAYVTEFRSPVEVHPDDSLLDLVLRMEYEELVEDTLLDQLPFELELSVSIPGRFREVYEHVSVHRYYLGLELEREIPMLEAAESWARNVYLPVVKVIRDLKVLNDFPERTETDLYLWLMKHEWELEASLGIDLPTEAVAFDLTQNFSTRMLHRVKRWWRRLWKFW